MDAEPEQISAPNDHFEPQVAKVSRKKPRQGPKVKENLRKPVAALMSPAELAAVKVTVENVPIAGTRRDVSLHDNNTSNVSRITTSVEDTIDSVVGTIGENEITSGKLSRLYIQRIFLFFLHSI